MTDAYAASAFQVVGIVVLVLLLLPFFFLMTRAATNGDAMDKPNRVRQWYGYTVCLIAVVTGLMCLAGALDDALDLTNPLAAQAPFGESLSSFEAYKGTRNRPSFVSDERAGPDTASDATLRTRYEALRADRISQRSFEARKGLIKDMVMLIVAVVLFGTHWRWLRQVPEPEHAGRAA